MDEWTDPGLTPDSMRPSAVTFGNFDGVHLGHRALLARLTSEARQRHVPAVAVTFEPHPLAVVAPSRAPEPVTSTSLRSERIRQTEVDGLLSIEFTPHFAQLSPDEFVEQILVEALQVQVVVVGRDCSFGSRNSGNADYLQRLGHEHDFDVVILDDVGESDSRWSSSTVRRLLREGQVAEAAAILGTPHAVVGEVVHGHHRGREIGYPTANLSAHAEGMVPAEGVYAGWLTQLDREPSDPDRRLPAAISIGTNPTFDTDDRRTVEAYVLDRDDLELYGQPVMVEFVSRLRPTLKFAGLDELLDAMATDVAQAREILAAPAER